MKKFDKLWNYALFRGFAFITSIYLLVIGFLFIIALIYCIWIWEFDVLRMFFINGNWNKILALWICLGFIFSLIIPND